EEAALASKMRQEQVEDLFTEIIPVNYAIAKDLLSQVEGKLSKRGTVSADERTNSVLLTDIKAVVKEAKNIIKHLDSPIPQVLIEARIVQTNPTFTSEIGIAWGGSYTNTAGAGDYTISGAAGGSNYAINLPSSGIFGGIAYGFISDRYTLDLQLTAMEKDEKVKIISRPKIVTVDNKQAKIEQGVSLPYLKQTEDGISTEFKNATLTLEVTPHITPDGSIIMKVLAKKDQKSSQTGYGGEPGIDTRSAETEVLVKDGETTVIGGIYERTQTYAESGVPFLSKIPILGWLFKNEFKKDEITELLIFLTPTIIKQKPIT
ncbi:MAG: type IV pilus secretin PilQ, partial [Thermodesulfobacteriota bacterium]|nr:type IV pilus secretin PilQ [Thermodesulfobacteriota bacterium]